MVHQANGNLCSIHLPDHLLAFWSLCRSVCLLFVRPSSPLIRARTTLTIHFAALLLVRYLHCSHIRELLICGLLLAKLKFLRPWPLFSRAHAAQLALSSLCCASCHQTPEHCTSAEPCAWEEQPQQGDNASLPCIQAEEFTHVLAVECC